MHPRAFLQKLRELTRAHRIVLVFDEVVTGFRIGPGGAQQHLGVYADLAAYGKVLGGGLPVGALAGRAELMAGVDGGVWQYGDASAPRGRRTYFAGTMCKHPLVMAAVGAMLDHIIAHGHELYPTLNGRMARLASELNEWWASQDVGLYIAHYGSQFRFVVPTDVALVFFQALTLSGVYTWEARAAHAAA